MLVRYTVEERRRVTRLVDLDQVDNLEELYLVVERDEGVVTGDTSVTKHLQGWEIVPLPHGA